VPAFRQPFVDGDLSSGVLTVNHNLNSQYVSVTVYNNSGLIIIPDDVDAVTANQITIDLTSYGALTGTYQAVIIDSGATQQQIPVATNLNLSGQTAEDSVRFDGVNWLAVNNTVKVVSLTKALTDATASQGITGVGFKPKGIIAFAASSGGGGNVWANWGMQDDSLLGTGIHNNRLAVADDFGVQGSEIVFIDQGGSATYAGTVTSMDADGFTISWIRGAGAPTGTMAVKFYCTR